LSLVLDASMTIAWLFNAERSTIVKLVVRRVAAEGALAPSIWRLEVANSLRNAVKRRRCTAQYAVQSMHRLAQLRVSIDSETDRHAWDEIWGLSLTHGLTAYDAAYLELAMRAGKPLASCDAALVTAGKRVGLETISP
jgi:predicted nucleic acid-binding protein